VGLLKFLEQLLSLNQRILKLPIVRHFLDLPSSIAGDNEFDDEEGDEDEGDEDGEDGEWH
jgi:hypothetical protein